MMQQENRSLNDSLQRKNEENNNMSDIVLMENV